MKKRACLFAFVFCLSLAAGAQQITQYSQYMLNVLGMNPAYAGEKGPIEFLIGHRAQWVGFSNAPLSNFAGGTMSFGKKGFYKGWHGVGAYVEEDKAGMFVNKGFNVMYSYHRRLAHGYVFAAGISVGVSIIGLDGSLYNAADPALALYPALVNVLPLVSPGFRLYSKYVYFDFAVKQLLNNETVAVDGVKELGTNNRLHPQLLFTVGRKYVSGNYAWTFLPSVQLHTSLLYLPAVEANLLVFYHKFIGLGVSYRNLDAVVFMLQFHPTSKIVLGLAYDYSISRLANGYANSQEAMFGFSPDAVPDQEIPRTRIARCPGFDL
jgi:type IX secretion system PorP/SprF family membrane protein